MEQNTKIQIELDSKDDLFAIIGLLVKVQTLNMCVDQDFKRVTANLASQATKFITPEDLK